MPSTMQVKVIKAPTLSIDAVRLEILNALRKEGREEVRQLKRTVETWIGEKPTFDFKIGLTKTTASVTTFPGGNAEGVEKWERLDRGVPPQNRTIRPVTPGVKALRFKGTYTAKTIPGIFASHSGGGSGDTVYRKSARHLPDGIKARQWLKSLRIRRRRPFNKLMVDAMNRGLKKARKKSKP